MKAYTLAAVLFRVGGITLLLRSAYYFLGFLTTPVDLPIHSGVDRAGYLSMFIQLFIPGIVVYLAAPLLAKVTAWKIQD